MTDFCGKKSLPDKQRLSLCEVVTWIAYGEALDSELLFALGYPSDRKYANHFEQLLRQCCYEAQADGIFVALLRKRCKNLRNPDDLSAVEVTTEDLLSVSQYLPASGQSLFEVKKNWEIERSVEERKEMEAFDAIQSAAIGGRLRLRGRRDNGAGQAQDYSWIDAAHLDRQHELSWRMSSLTLRQYRPDPTDAGTHWSVWSTDKDRFSYSDITLERIEFQEWLKNTSPTRARSTMGSETACKKWLTEIMLRNLDSRTQSNNKLLQSFREIVPGFPERSFRRALSAAINETGATAWRKGGRPRKSSNTVAP